VRYAAVRVQFKSGDRFRDYLIAYSPGRSNHHVRRPGVWSAESFAATGLPVLDLRKPADAVKIEKVLMRLGNR
jgi:hypothetical protein